MGSDTDSLRSVPKLQVDQAVIIIIMIIAAALSTVLSL